MDFAKGAKVVFLGDSVTDAARDRWDDADLGWGYVRFIAQELATRPDAHTLTIVNRGIDGNRLVDLAGRLRRDCLALHPALVSILIGINDVWWSFESGRHTSSDNFGQLFKRVLTQVTTKTEAKLVLLEPFLVPAEEYQWAWRAELDARIEIIRKAAQDFGAILIPADSIMNAAEDEGESTTLDGVHPTEYGHKLLARSWVSAVFG
ncbi:MAG: SGNH/GDSL hydrolase family protein [Propionibacteriaceae bacterium]|jgi:lysophospholipase L1-like esterase|nr:SGNH/GDSL hydrolase family protein [Propionibacteriaceae bacterium]